MIKPSDGVLARFTRDLTADARAGRLEPVRCRADEPTAALSLVFLDISTNAWVCRVVISTSGECSAL